MQGGWRSIEVSPSGLTSSDCRSTHGARRGLPSAALQAEKIEQTTNIHDQVRDVDFDSSRGKK